MLNNSCCDCCKNFILHILFATVAGFGVLFFFFAVYVSVLYNTYELNEIHEFALVWGYLMAVGFAMVAFEILSIITLCVCKNSKTHFFQNY